MEVRVCKRGPALYFTFGESASPDEMIALSRELSRIQGLNHAGCVSANSTKAASVQFSCYEGDADYADFFAHFLEQVTDKIVTVFGPCTRFAHSEDLDSQLFSKINRWNENREAACLLHHLDPIEVRRSYEGTAMIVGTVASEA